MCLQIMSVPISNSISNCYSNVCIYLFTLIVQRACVCICSNIILCVCVFVSCTLDVHVLTSLSFLDHVSDLLFCMFAHTYICCSEQFKQQTHASTGVQEPSGHVNVFGLKLLAMSVAWKRQRQNETFENLQR